MAEHRPQPRGLRRVVAQRLYQIICTNAQLPDLCDAVYASIQGRDSKTAEHISALQLQYVTCLCYYYRLTSIAELYGYPPNLQSTSELRMTTKGIQLPGILCKYIEALGPVRMNAETRVTPWLNESSNVRAAYDEHYCASDP